MRKILVFLFILCCFVGAGCQKRGLGPSVTPPPVDNTGSAASRENSPHSDSIQSPIVSLPNLSFEDLEKRAMEHVVLSGETLSEIAEKYHVGTGLLKRLNNIENVNQIRIGQKLKVIEGPFSIVIHKAGKVLTVSLKDQEIKSYDVAIGKNDSTPEGDFTILNKMIEPIWTDPYLGDLVKAGDPRYPLGTRWMQFAPYGYGIHGTNDPSSIKSEASFGCIRMLNPDVEELYDWVCIGSKVQVLP